MRFVLAFLSLALLPLSAQEEKDAREGRDAWSIRSYSFPSTALEQRYPFEEKNRLQSPEIPPMGATEEDIDRFLIRSHEILESYLEMEGISLPEGSLVAFDPETLTLVARVPGRSHEEIGSLADSLSAYVEQFLTMKGTVLEAPIDAVVRAVEEGALEADHAKQLTDLLDHQDTEVLHLAHLQTQSGQKAKTGSGTLIVRPDGWGVEESGKRTFEGISGTYDSGASWEIEPVVGAEGKHIGLNVMVEAPLAAAKESEEVMFWQDQEVRATQRISSRAGTFTSVVMVEGQTRLIGSWPSQVPKRQQCAFLSIHVVRNLPVPSKRLLGMVEARGEALKPIPKESPVSLEGTESIPDGMSIQLFRVRPSFFYKGIPRDGEISDDPFADLEGGVPLPVEASPKEILESMGVSFPPGSSATYSRETSTLTVQNTAENLDLITALVENTWIHIEASIRVTTYILEAPSGRILQLADQSLLMADHWDLFRKLRELADAEMLSLCWTESRSVQRARVFALQDIGLGTNFGLFSSEPGETGEKVSEGEGISESSKLSSFGSVLEVDPQIGPDGVTLDLIFKLDHDYSPPVLRQGASKSGPSGLVSLPEWRFYRSNQETALTMRSGAVRMVGHWKVKGKAGSEERRQIAFVHAAILRNDEEWARP